MVAALAIAAHGCAGGGFPDSADGAALILLSIVAGTVAARLPLGVFGVLGTLAAGQFAGHVVLSGMVGHGHAAIAQPPVPLPGAGMLFTHGLAAAVGGALILLAQRLYDFACATVLAVITRPVAGPLPRLLGSAATGPGPSPASPNGAIGPRAPPVPAR
ncbi:MULTISPECIES: hypothetical protein [Nocardia]|uniref:hypothetical protein n=1 Tax=Nocardia TaxID=1817 RepID=UPI0013002335|nr:MULTISPECIES: hypothetical protein [Nocardia]